MQSETIFVQAKFQTNYVERVVKVPTGHTTKNFLGFTKEETRNERQVHRDGTSDCGIDGEQLSRDVSKTINDKLRDGYRVLTIVPITSGNWAYQTGKISGGGNNYGSKTIDPVQGDFGYSYGYSYTEGMLITFVKE